MSNISNVERLAVQSAKNGSEVVFGADIEASGNFGLGRGMRRR